MDESVQKQLEAPARVGEFQDVADAILRGCLVTAPIYDDAFRFAPGTRCVTHACVWAAYMVGAGQDLAIGASTRFYDVVDLYQMRYGAHPIDDFEINRLPREQIAARIAAL